MGDNLANAYPTERCDSSGILQLDLKSDSACESVIATHSQHVNKLTHDTDKSGGRRAICANT